MNRRERRGLYSGARAAAINTTVISKQKAVVKQMQKVQKGENNRQGLK